MLLVQKSVDQISFACRDSCHIYVKQDGFVAFYWSTDSFLTTVLFLMIFFVIYNVKQLSQIWNITCITTNSNVFLIFCTGSYDEMIQCLDVIGWLFEDVYNEYISANAAVIPWWVSKSMLSVVHVPPVTKRHDSLRFFCLCTKINNCVELFFSLCSHKR